MVKRMWGEVILLQYNPALKRALPSHRRRHREVTLGKPEANQKCIVCSFSVGFGNRVQALASVLIAASLSGRVFLMEDRSTPLRSFTAAFLQPTLLPFVEHGNASHEAFRYESLRVLFWFFEQ
ncbi:hypothetical protein TcYC6_0115030 [Trypanosoma cruzi]|nr:hypothetical protein TcYC6_0115030 [Trypanosoma cruzi]